MNKKDEAIKEINEFLETTPDEFVKDTLVFVTLKVEKELNKNVESDLSSREAALEQMNTLLLELPERSVSFLPTCLSIGFEMFKEYYPAKGESSCGII